MIEVRSENAWRTTDAKVFTELLQELGTKTDIAVYLNSFKLAPNKDAHIFVNTREQGATGYIIPGVVSTRHMHYDVTSRNPTAEVRQFPSDLTMNWESTFLTYPHNLDHPVVWVDRELVVAVTTDTAAYLPDFISTGSNISHNSIAYADFIRLWQEGIGQNWEYILTDHLSTLSQHCNRVKVIRAETEFDTNRFMHQAIKAVAAAKATATRRADIKIARMKAELAQVKQQPMVDALRITGIVVDAGFEFENPTTLRYTLGDINTYIVKMGDNIYEMDTEMGISGLRVIIDKVGTMVNAWCSESHHPNAERRTVCMGTLHNAPISQLGEFVPTLRIPNIDSCYDTRGWEERVEAEGVLMDDPTWFV